MEEYKIIATTFNCKSKKLGTFKTLQDAQQEIENNFEKWKKEIKLFQCVEIQLWENKKLKRVVYERLIAFEDMYE